MDAVIAEKINERVKKSRYEFVEDIKKKMTRARALDIRKWRFEYGSTWGAIAQNAYDRWGTDALWTPASNGVAGSVLCSEAADMLGEDCSVDPWV